MKAISDKIFIRNLESENLTDLFFISAVLSIILIRVYLFLTNYPQIGGGGLHIAHMLWGGLLMLVAIFMFINLLSRHAYKAAAILGGVGFGTFIDELGKFITSDNNYFFQPTIALIYIIFILLYFASKLMPKLKPVSSQEYLINALELTKEAIIDDMDFEEKERALKYLQKSKENQITNDLKRLLLKFNSIKVQGVGKFKTLSNKIKALYWIIIKKSWFIKVVLVLFIVQLITTLFNFGEFIVPLTSSGIVILAFPELMELIFSTISALFILLGMVRLYFARLFAYQMFKISLLISIFLTQIFDFYHIELLGIFDLASDLFVLGIITYMINREKAV